MNYDVKNLTKIGAVADKAKSQTIKPEICKSYFVGRWKVKGNLLLKQSTRSIHHILQTCTYSRLAHTIINEGIK